jgi:hypothetical protein
VSDFNEGLFWVAFGFSVCFVDAFVYKNGLALLDVAFARQLGRIKRLF